MATRAPRARGVELLQPPALYLLGFGALLLASPLEALFGDATARLLACLAFNGVIYAALRVPLALAPVALAVLRGAGIGVLIAMPSVLGGSFSFPVGVVAAVVVVDAAWEELLFRGLAFDFAFRRYGPWGALALSSLCFASAHLLDTAAADPLSFTYLLLAGLLLGAVRLHSGSLWPALALHAVHNLMLSGSMLERPAWGSVAAAAVLVAVLIVRLRRSFASSSATAASVRKPPVARTPGDSPRGWP